MHPQTQMKVPTDAPLAMMHPLSASPEHPPATAVWADTDFYFTGLELFYSCNFYKALNQRPLWF